jgi:hypothetical protein
LRKILTTCRSHLDTHKAFACPDEECTSTFAEERGVARHWKTVHEKTAYKSCETCRRKFTRKDHYNRHAKTCSTMTRKQRLNR